MKKKQLIRLNRFRIREAAENKLGSTSEAKPQEAPKAPDIKKSYSVLHKHSMVDQSTKAQSTKTQISQNNHQVPQIAPLLRKKAILK